MGTANQLIADASALVDVHRQVVNQASADAASQATAQVPALTAQVQASPTPDTATAAQRSLHQITDSAFVVPNYKIDLASLADTAKRQEVITGLQASRDRTQAQLHALPSVTQSAITQVIQEKAQTAQQLAQAISQSIAVQLSNITDAAQAYLNSHTQALENQFASSMSQTSAERSASTQAVQRAVEQAYQQIDTLTSAASNELNADELAQINQSVKAQADALVATFTDTANQLITDANALIDAHRQVVNQASANAATQAIAQVLGLTAQVQATPTPDAATAAQRSLYQITDSAFMLPNNKIDLASLADTAKRQEVVTGIQTVRDQTQVQLYALPRATQNAITQAIQEKAQAAQQQAQSISQSIAAQLSGIIDAAQAFLTSHTQALENQFASSTSQTSAELGASAQAVQQRVEQAYQQVNALTGAASTLINADELAQINQSVKAQADALAATFTGTANQLIADANVLIDAQRQVINQASADAASRASAQVPALTAQVQVTPTPDAATAAQRNLHRITDSAFILPNNKIDLASLADTAKRQEVIVGIQAARDHTQAQLETLPDITQNAIAKAANTYPFTTYAGGSLTVPGHGVIPLAEDIATALLQGIRSAIAALGEIGLAAASRASAVGFAALAYPNSTASQEQDQIPARYRFGMGIDAEELGLAPGSDLNTIGSSQGSVKLPYRLTNEIQADGRSLFSVVAADGVNVYKDVPVRAATLDPQRGRYSVAVPSLAADQPAITLTWTPASPPGDSSLTSTTPAQPPAVPVYTGVELKPLNIEALAYPGVVPDINDLIIYFPADSGHEPIYLMFSNPYGDTNAKGRYSGREYNTERSGGPILDLDWTAVSITQEGLDLVRLHTSRFGDSPDNLVMIERLRSILSGEIQVADVDKRFYSHEIRELERYRALGIKDGEIPRNYDEVWNNTHTASLEDYKIDERKNPLYTREAEEAYYKAEEKK